MSNEHQSAGVNETNRNKVVVLSAPAATAQASRAAAIAQVVPFNYTAGPKFGGP